MVMVGNLNSKLSENLLNLVRLYKGVSCYKNAANPLGIHILLTNSPRSFRRSS